MVSGGAVLVAALVRLAVAGGRHAMGVTAQSVRIVLVARASVLSLLVRASGPAGEALFGSISRTALGLAAGIRGVACIASLSVGARSRVCAAETGSLVLELLVVARLASGADAG